MTTYRSQKLEVEKVGSELTIAQKSVAAKDVTISERESETYVQIGKSEAALVGWDKVHCVRRGFCGLISSVPLVDADAHTCHDCELLALLVLDVWWNFTRVPSTPRTLKDGID